ncbi:cytochrome P450 [Periconia macrospinosa]|uniref:Cytochrome P450 n=1 Tax=Periconia macrospinosa TaxID=97972 RepID=A0A2V1DJ71_9PLEO|nr:cytochrome P450 [Periconia macrospinosa]
MDLFIALKISALLLIFGFGYLSIILYTTQGKDEPYMIPSKLPFLESTVELLRGKTAYLANLKKKYRVPIFTLRMPGQRVYVVSGTQLVQSIQSKANASTFVANLLDFGILFSGMSKDAKEVLKAGYSHGNQFTASVHKYLLFGPTLKAASSIAVEKLTAGMQNGFASHEPIGLLETIQHQLTLAMTGAVYGPANPFQDPEMESNWRIFVRGISHLVNSPVPWLTAPSAIRARARLTRGFQEYFQKGGHLQAFAMVPEMHNNNIALGVPADEMCKMEIATSLAMLSSGSISSFWLLHHILSNQTILNACRSELLALVTSTTSDTGVLVKSVDTSLIKAQCPTIMAMFYETFRYHSSVVSVKKVAHDTTLGSPSYALKKDALVMIPGNFVHLDTNIWGHTAEVFDHTRFLASADAQKKLGTTTAFRPFGAGATACPGRHFSTNVILTLVAIVLLRFDVEAADVDGEGKWILPPTKNADMWNAMPKPDHDVAVLIRPKQADKNVEYKFFWGNGADGEKIADLDA